MSRDEYKLTPEEKQAIHGPKQDPAQKAADSINKVVNKPKAEPGIKIPNTDATVIAEGKVKLPLKDKQSPVEGSVKVKIPF